MGERFNKTKRQKFNVATVSEETDEIRFEPIETRGSDIHVFVRFSVI